MNNIRALQERIRSEVSDLKEEKKQVCEELDKFSYEETMIGKDLIELKIGINTGLDSASLIIKQIQDFPDFLKEVNSTKESLAESIVGCYEIYLSKLQTYNKTLESRASISQSIKETKKRVLDSEIEFKKLENCYSINTRFFNNEKEYHEECISLEARKEELQEEIDECADSSITLYRYSPDKLESHIGELTEEQALFEYERNVRRNKTLLEAIEHQKKHDGLNISEALNESDKSHLVTKQYNTIIKEQRQRIDMLRKKHQGLKEDIQKLQSYCFQTYVIDDKLTTLNQIIQRCKEPMKDEHTLRLKKLLRKKTFIKSIESAVTKAREVAKIA